MWIWEPKPSRLRPRAVLGRARRAHVRAHDRAVQPHRGQIRLVPQVSHQARPDALSAPAGIAAIDRVPLPVVGRPPTPGSARPRHPAQRGHEKATTSFVSHVYTRTGTQKRSDTEPLGIGQHDHGGAILKAIGKGIDSREDNRGRTGCLIQSQGCRKDPVLACTQSSTVPNIGRAIAEQRPRFIMLSDRRGRPLRPLGLRLTGGQRHDSTQARALVEPWTAAPLSCLIANRA